MEYYLNSFYFVFKKMFYYFDVWCWMGKWSIWSYYLVETKMII